MPYVGAQHARSREAQLSVRYKTRRVSLRVVSKKYLCCAQCCCGPERRRARARARAMVIQNDYPSWRRQLRHTSPQRSLSPVSKGAVALPFLLPRSPPTTTANSTMQAIRLQKKYPEVTQEEMFDLINRFKCVNVM